jgi:tetratricopeptide (TPR) repeat protein
VIFFLAEQRAGGGESAGFSMPHLGPLTYAATQFGVIVKYLQLSFWPAHLCIDYHWPIAETVASILPPAIIVTALGAGTIWAIVKRSAFGFGGACFFVILSPTSTILPIRDLLVEHRMYLPLAPLVTVVVLGIYMLAMRVLPKQRWRVWFACCAVAGIVVALGLRTATRNMDYHDEVTLWASAARLYPHNPRAQQNLGSAFLAAGKPDPSARHYQQAIDLYGQLLARRPNDVMARSVLGRILLVRGRTDDAIAQHRRTVEIKSDYTRGYKNLAVALAERGKFAQAADAFRQALALRPNVPAWHFRLGQILLKLGQGRQAETHFREVLRLMSFYPGARFQLGVAIARTGRPGEAIEHFEQALRAGSAAGNLHNELGMAMFSIGNVDGAIEHFRRAISSRPTDAGAYCNLGTALLTKRMPDHAIRQFQLAIGVNATYQQAYDSLAAAFAESGRFDEAANAIQRAIQLADKAGRGEQAEQFRQRLELYKQQGKPSRKPPDN